MRERDEVIGALQGSGVVDGLRWSFVSTVSRVLETYSEADGHNRTLLGTMKHVQLQDRLDRVFSCGRYSVHSGEDEADLDVVYAELSKVDIESMPHLPRGLVRRADLNGSPGWAHGEWRILMASCDYGKLHELPWPTKSRTKRKVAAQVAPDLPQPTLFDDLVDDDGAPIVLELPSPEELDLATFVLAHTLDPVKSAGELVLGRPRLNAGGGDAWHWTADLLALPPGNSGRRSGIGPQPTGPDTVPDAPVRVRPAAERPQTGPESKAGQ